MNTYTTNLSLRSSPVSRLLHRRLTSLYLYRANRVRDMRTGNDSNEAHSRNHARSYMYSHFYKISLDSYDNIVYTELSQVRYYRRS